MTIEEDADNVDGLASSRAQDYERINRKAFEGTVAGPLDGGTPNHPGLHPAADTIPWAI